MINWKQMIEVNEIFSENDPKIALWAGDDIDTNDLAMMAQNIMDGEIHLASVAPEMVELLWAYLEKNNVEIFTRYEFSPTPKNITNDISELAKKISYVCKHGANGVQLFLKMNNFERVLDSLVNIRDDLFFEHKLSVCMDIKDVDVHNWDLIFKKLRDIKADSFSLTFNKDLGDKSDFIGRIYSMLKNWNFDGDLHFILISDLMRIDQILRLTESMQPKICDKLRFFFEY